MELISYWRPVIIQTPRDADACHPHPCYNVVLPSGSGVVATAGTHRKQMRRSIFDHRSRSACACLHAASPLKADQLNEASPRHPLRVEDASGTSLTSVAAISSPRSRSFRSRGMGIAAVGDSLTVSAACIWMSSPSGTFASLFPATELDTRFGALPIERTTSPLHIGQVRRRVVNHGVMHSAWNS